MDTLTVFFATVLLGLIYLSLNGITYFLTARKDLRAIKHSVDHLSDTFSDVEINLVVNEEDYTSEKPEESQEVQDLMAELSDAYSQLNALSETKSNSATIAKVQELQKELAEAKANLPDKLEKVAALEERLNNEKAYSAHLTAEIYAYKEQTEKLLTQLKDATTALNLANEVIESQEGTKDVVEVTSLQSIADDLAAFLKSTENALLLEALALIQYELTTKPEKGEDVEIFTEPAPVVIDERPKVKLPTKRKAAKITTRDDTKLNDTTKQHICNAYDSWSCSDKATRPTQVELVAQLNEELNLNKSVRAYSRIWNNSN